MINLHNEPATISIAGTMVSGKISGTVETWSFQSTDEAFMVLFPAGAVYSFSQYGPYTSLEGCRKLQMEVANKVQELIAAVSEGPLIGKSAY